MKRALDSYYQDTFTFIEAAQKATDLNTVSALIIDQFKRIGFEYLTVWTLPAPGQPPEEGVMLNTRPMAYIERYVAEDQMKIDPAITELRRTVRPYSWSDIKARTPLTKKELSIIDEAQEFGINDGMVIPIISCSGSVALVSPCGENPDLSDRARSAAEIIGVVGHQALQRILWDKSKPKIERPHLTKRECEILQWVAYGKSDDEIGEILNIKAGTVTVHYQNASRKLNATKRTSAMIAALKWGFIHL